MNGNQVSLTLAGTTIFNTISATGRGGLAYINQASNINIAGATVNGGTSVLSGSMIYSIATLATF